MPDTSISGNLLKQWAEVVRNRLGVPAIGALMTGDHVYQIFKQRSITRPRREFDIDGPNGGPAGPTSCCSIQGWDSELSSQRTVSKPPTTAPQLPPPGPETLASYATSPAPEQLLTHEAVALEQMLIDILSRDPEPRETIDAAFRRKEQQVGDVFATLTPVEARAVFERLEAGRVTDTLARQFGRLAIERRQRLLAFLSDTPRRAELARKGRP